MADDGVLGSVSVAVRADLSAYDVGVDLARQKAKALDSDLAQASRNVEQVTRAMGVSAANSLGQMTTAATANATATKAMGSQWAAVAAVMQGAVPTERQLTTQTEALAKAAQDAAVAAYQNADAQNASGNAHRTSATEAEKATGKYKLNSMQVMELTGLVRHSIDQLAAGGSIMQVAAMHAGTLGQALGSGEGGVAGGLSALGAVVNPVTIGIAALTGVVALGAIAWWDYTKAVEHFAQESQGIGRFTGLTGRQLEQLSVDTAKAGKVSLQTGRDLVDAYMRAGTIGPEMNAKLAASTRDVAAAMGEKIPEAAKKLAQQFGDPAKGAQQLNEALGILSYTEQRQVEDLANAGRYAEAQKILYDRLREATKGAADQQDWLSRKLEEVGNAFSNAKAKAGEYINDVGPGIFGVIGAGLAMDSGNLHTAPAPNAPAPMTEAQRQLEAQRQAALAQMNRQTVLGGQTAEQVNPDIAARRAMQVQRERLESGQSAAGALRQDDAFKDMSDALERVTQAQQTYLDQGPRMRAEQDAQLAMTRAITPAQKAEAAAQAERVRLAGQYMTAAERERSVEMARQQVLAAAAASMTSQNLVLETNTRATLALAEADLKGAAAGQRAEATRKAVTQTVLTGGDAVQQAAINLADAVAQQGKAAADTAMKTEEQAQAQAKANDAVAAGNMTTDEANRLMQIGLALLPIDAALTNADAEATETLLKVKVALAGALAHVNEETARAAALKATESDRDAETRAKLELELLSATNRERAVALARLAAEQQLRREGGDKLVNSPAGQARIEQAGSTAGAGADLAPGQFTQNLTDSLEAQRSALRDEAEAYGMTREAGLRFKIVQQALTDAARQHIELTDQQVAAINKAAEAYAHESVVVQELERRQRAAADAATELSDQTGDALTDIITGSKDAASAARDLVRALDADVLHAVLQGKGPFAGMFGTNRNENGAPGGILGNLFNKTLGVPNEEQGATTALGPFTNAVNMATNALQRMAGGAGGGGGPGGILSSLFGSGGGGGFGSTGDLIDAAGSFGAGGGGFSSLAGLFHSGVSSVGASAPSVTRQVNPRIFLGAPRLHTGLDPDEFPAILQRGEKVSPRYAAKHGGRPINMTVVTQDAGSFERTRRQQERGLKRRLATV